MASDPLMLIHDPELLARGERVLGAETVDPRERREFLTGAPIDIAENVWIGAGAMILPGVSIGRDSVIAAGAVVAEDVPASSLVTGAKGAVHRSW